STTSLFSFSPKVPLVKQFKSFIYLHIASQDEKLTFILSRSQEISKKMAFLVLWNLSIKPEKEIREKICKNSPAMDECRSCKPVLRYQKNSKNSANFTGYSTRVDEQL
ncbi:unnamed protein product, partial [Prunus brigantina]